MTDLQRLQKRVQGHLAEAEEWLHEAPPEHANDAKKEVEDWQLNALVLSVLDRVRSECDVRIEKLWDTNEVQRVIVQGPPDLLRQLAERLKQG